MKRSSWLDVLAEQSLESGELSAPVRQTLTQLDDLLFREWNLGDNVILGWTREAGQLRVLAVRHYSIIEGVDATLMNSVLAGPKHLAPQRLAALAAQLGEAARVVSAPMSGVDAPDPRLIDSIVTRYSVSLVRERAVMLIDAVGFSLRSPLEQVGMLNSMSYSVNSAYRQLLSEDVKINFARTTTGDGFYIWNRARTPAANMALYELLMLILADNAIAARKARSFPVPQLRAAFHVGEHYEFYQVEALNPTSFGYIVGQVTIDLARLVEKARPGQILLGDFEMEWPDEAGATRDRTPGFVERTADTMDRHHGLVVGGDEIRQIRCYLTGAGSRDGGFQVTPLRISDKHGIQHAAYNAKINIHRKQSESIYLGLQHKLLDA